jgi:dTMP kinase
MVKKKSHFISIEGIEGMGKTTVFNALRDYLAQQSIDFTLTREPGGTAIAEGIRDVLLAHDDELLTPMGELLLMFASRAQHVAHVIKPALKEGRWVICDRFVDASYAYQGGGRNLSQDKLDALAAWTCDVMPDVTLLLDAAVDVGVQRIAKRTTKDRIEVEKHDFFERARAAYLKRAAQEPGRFVVIDASLPMEQVIANVIAHIAPMIQNNT